MTPKPSWKDMQNRRTIVLLRAVAFFLLILYVSLLVGARIPSPNFRHKLVTNSQQKHRCYTL